MANTKQMAKKSTTEKTQVSFAVALTGEEATQLNSLIGEIPAKFANPLYQFFQLVAQKRKAEADMRNSKLAPPTEG